MKFLSSGKGESEIARFCAKVLKRAGVSARLHEAAPGRPNVIGTLRGTGGGRTLVLNAHTDTVTLEGMTDPLSGRVEGNRLYGRGAFDTKGGLAAGLAAILALKAGGVALRGDVIMVGAVDEEYVSLGTEALVKQVRGDGCIILEPTGLGLCLAHGGFVWAEIETRGVAAHGSMPDKGVDAIVKMGSVLVEVGELASRLQQGKSFYSPLAREAMRPSLHASLIDGGRELSSYPDRCRVQMERRLVPGESAGDFQRELDTIVGGLKDRDPSFQASSKITFAREPWQALEGPLLAALDLACADVLGARPARMATMGWLDSAIMHAVGIPCVIFGPAGDGAHALVEYVDIASVVACARVLARAAMEFCA